MAYPKILDAGDLNSKFDVIIFADGAFRAGGGGRGGGGGGRGGGGRDVPAEFVATQGSITEATTLPQIKKFVEAGGGIEVMGGSSSMAMALGIPISNYMASETADGREVNIPQTEFYIPGSLIRANIDNTDPLAYGMPSQVEIFFENNPTYKLGPTAASMHVTPVAWYSGTHLLDSGWAWGQEHLDGGTAIVDAPLGKGKVMAMGPQVTFRGEPHGTFKLMFNGLYYSSAEPTTLH